jgi:cytochrome c-type biogenesis protein CcmH/NrfF
MAKVTVHHDRLSRYSALLMILLGIVTWLLYGFPGVVIIVVGVIMYWFYLRQTKVAQASGKPHVGKGSAA